MPAHYFLGTRYLGAAPAHWWSDTQLSGASQLLVCPTCGDAWGRIALDSAPTDWLPVRMGCSQHPWATSDVGGTFLPSWLRRIENLPLEVLRYEVSLRLRQFPSPNQEELQ